MPSRAVTKSLHQTPTRLKQILVQQKRLLEEAVTSLIGTDKSAALAKLGEIEALGTNYTELTKFAKIASGQVVQFFLENWSNLPPEFTQAFTGGVAEYLREKFGYGLQMASMYAEVWQTWFSGRYDKNKYVRQVASFEVRPPVARLADAAQYVVQGQMTENRWKVLTARGVSRTYARQQLKSDLKVSSTAGIKPTKNTVVQLVEETGDLRIFVAGKMEQVGFLNINSSNAIVRRRINEIVARSQIRRFT